MKTLRVWAVMALLCVGIAACGSSSSSSSSSTSNASAGNTSSSASTTASSSSNKPVGTVGVLLSTAASESIQHWGSTASKALKSVGWNVIVTDGKGEPTVLQQGMQNFINQHVTAIITTGFDPSEIVPQLQAAKAAGIPTFNVGVSVSGVGAPLYTASYSPSDAEFGVIAANWLVKQKQYPSGTQYITLDITASRAGHLMIVGAEPVLKAHGWVLAGTHNMTDLSNIIQDATTGTQNVAGAHPQAKVLLTCCDFTPAPAVNGLKQANKSMLVVARYDNLSSLAAIRVNNPPVMIVAANADQSVLTAIDQILANYYKKAQISKTADVGKYHYAVVSKDNVPAAGAYYFDPDKQIAVYTAKWKAEYGL
jgi:ABC-type sugar transport system substrate-binding protein